MKILKGEIEVGDEVISVAENADARARLTVLRFRGEREVILRDNLTKRTRAFYRDELRLVGKRAAVTAAQAAAAQRKAERAEASEQKRVARRKAGA